MKLYNMCILPIFLYGSNCCAISKTDAHRIHTLNKWCLHMLLGIKWHQFVQSDDVQRLMKQPKLTAIMQMRQLTMFGHIARMHDNADTKRILSASLPADWRRQPGCPCITWLSTIQQDLRHHHLTLPEAADLAQNRPLWRMLPTLWCYAILELHARNDVRRDRSLTANTEQRNRKYKPWHHQAHVSRSQQSFVQNFRWKAANS